MTDEQAERIVSLALRMRAVEARLIVKATEGTLKELRELQLEAVKLTQDCGGRHAVAKWLASEGFREPTIH